MWCAEGKVQPRAGCKCGRASEVQVWRGQGRVHAWRGEGRLQMWPAGPIVQAPISHSHGRVSKMQAWQGREGRLQAWQGEVRVQNAGVDEGRVLPHLQLPLPCHACTLPLPNHTCTLALATQHCTSLTLPCLHIAHPTLCSFPCTLTLTSTRILPRLQLAQQAPFPSCRPAYLCRLQLLRPLPPAAYLGERSLVV